MYVTVSVVRHTKGEFSLFCPCLFATRAGAPPAPRCPIAGGEALKRREGRAIACSCPVTRHPCPRCSTAVPASRKWRRAAPARVRRAVGVGAAAPGQRTACWKGRERRSPPGARRQRKRRPPSQITVERVERTCPERSGRDRGGQEACTHTRTVAVRGRHRRRDPRHAKMYSRPALVRRPRGPRNSLPPSEGRTEASRAPLFPSHSGHSSDRWSSDPGDAPRA